VSFQFFLQERGGGRGGSHAASPTLAGIAAELVASFLDVAERKRVRQLCRPVVMGLVQNIGNAESVKHILKEFRDAGKGNW